MTAIIYEAIRSTMFWMTLLVTALVAYFGAYLVAHSCYRPEEPRRAPQVARAALGWGMLLSVLLPLAAAWRLEWSWIWAALLVVPFIVLGGVVLLTNSR
jgi:hypothetical protein